MDKDIWKDLAEIRKIFEKYPTKRLGSAKNREGQIVEDIEQQDDEYYNAYCVIGCAKYRDKSAVS